MSTSTRCLLALDQGTTSSRALLFDAAGSLLGTAQQEFPQHYPHPGWVEHDPLDLWHSQLAVARQVLQQTGISPHQLAGVGITIRRETCLLWHRGTGQPLGRAIVWQDRRTSAACAAWQARGLEATIRAKTGLLLDPYFSASKLQWLLDHTPQARQLAAQGDLCAGTVDSWLVWQLTAGARHISDVSNASRTMLFDLHTLDWDADLLALFNIPRSILPTVCDSCGALGELHPEVLGAPVPIAAIAGDQQAALFGQACFQPGMVKNTYGTGCFMLMNTGSTVATSSHRLLSTVAWKIGDQTCYALEGSVFVAGAVVQWLRDQLGIIQHASEVESLAASVPDNGGVVFVPAFTGLGTPYWDPDARGTLLGLTRGTTRGHIARAALESIAYQTAEVLGAMQADAQVPLRELRVDGGAARNDLLMQFQADLLQVAVLRPRITETTALGVAQLAGLATGIWPDRRTLAAQGEQAQRFEPAMPASQREGHMRLWHHAVQRARHWANADGA